jgi:type IV pilus modification protein PilV
VLISMIIMAVGLLGLGMLQGRALKANKDAYLYAQATLLAYEMSDRIKANPYWSNTASAIPTAAQISAAKTDDNDGTRACSNGYSCTTTQMAAYDMYYLQKNAAAVLPGVTEGDAGTPTNVPTVVRITTGNATTACPYIATAPSFCVTLTWTRTDSSISGLTTSKQELSVTP